MIITLNYLRERFIALNVQCFDNILTMPRLRLNNAYRALGSVRYKEEHLLFGRRRISDITLSISKSYDLAPKVFDEIILHEMIHLYILTQCGGDSSAHGVLFRRKMNEINAKYGYSITISHRGRLEEIARKRQNIVGVTTLSTGVCCVVRPSLRHIFRINALLARARDVNKVEWYNSSDVYFATFPRVRTAKLFHADEERVAQALKDAIPLVVEGNSIKEAKRS